MFSLVLLLLGSAAGIVGTLACGHDWGFMLGVGLYTVGAYTVRLWLWWDER